MATNFIEEIAEQYTGKECTLDGQPAKIVGRLNAYATVAPLDDKHPAVEFAWPTVKRVMENKEGKFKY